MDKELTGHYCLRNMFKQFCIDIFTADFFIFHHIKCIFQRICKVFFENVLRNIIFAFFLQLELFFKVLLSVNRYDRIGHKGIFADQTCQCSVDIIGFISQNTQFMGNIGSDAERYFFPFSHNEM